MHLNTVMLMLLNYETFNLTLNTKLGNRDLPAKALIFDSWYDKYRGVALLVAVVDGHLRLSQNITIAQTGKSYETKEIGILHPDPTPLRTL